MNISMNRVMMALACAQLNVLEDAEQLKVLGKTHSFQDIKREFKNGNRSLAFSYTFKRK